MTFSILTSVWLWDVTHSAFISALTFASQWVGAAVFPSMAAKLINKLGAGRTAPIADWTSAFMVGTASIFILQRIWLAIIPVVLLKGYIDSINRSANTVVIQQNASDPETIGRNVSRMEFFRIVGSTCAGVMFAVLGQQGSTLLIALACMLGHCSSGLTFWSCYAPSKSSSGNSVSYTASVAPKLRQLASMKSARRAALLQLSLISAFQGLHNAIRTAYPIQQLHQGTSGVGVISAIATAGVFAGGWLASRRRLMPQVTRSAAPLGACVTATIAIVASACKTPIPAYSIYFFFLMSFEMVYMGCNAQFVSSLDHATSALFVSVRSTTTSLSALLGLLSTSALMEWLPLTISVTITSSAFGVCSLLFAVHARITEARNATVGLS